MNCVVLVSNCLIFLLVFTFNNAINESNELVNGIRRKRQTPSLCLRNETYTCTKTIRQTYEQFCLILRPCLVTRERTVQAICNRLVYVCCPGYIEIDNNCVLDTNQNILESTCTADVTRLPFSNGIISSPNYPNSYSPGSDCLWEIIGTPGRQIIIQVTNINIEAPLSICPTVNSCSFRCLDQLTLDDGVQAWYLCGYYVSLSAFVSTAGSVTVRFQSNNVQEYPGFQLRYQISQPVTIPASVTSASTTVITANNTFATTTATSTASLEQLETTPFSVSTRSTASTFNTSNTANTTVSITTINERIPTQPQCYGETLPVQCLPTCSLSCENPNASLCGFPPADYCVPGCMCPPNLPIKHNGTCIRRESCPIPTLEQTFSCGTQFYLPNVRIVGGETAARGSWPWAVQIYRTFEEEKLQCGGAVICDRWILTAAHCFQDDEGHRFLDNPQYYRVEIGKHNRSTEFGTNAVVEIPQLIVRHPQYDRSRVLNDVALVRLSQRLQFSKTIRPVCLPDHIPPAENSRWGPNPGARCYAIGWGETLGRGPSNLQLKQAELSVRFGMFCSMLFSRFFNSSLSLCVGGISGDDTCTGDSGGPLLCKHGDRWFVDGITSFGFACGEIGQPGVYARVTTYSSWIRDTIRNECSDLNQRYIEIDE